MKKSVQRNKPEKRLFVPLCTEPFLDFKLRGKQYEVRACGSRQYTERNVYPGKKVEFRKGYSGESLHGSISDVIVGTLDDIFSQVDYRLVEPRSESREDAAKEVMSYFKQPEKYIAFRVTLTRRRTK